MYTYIRKEEEPVRESAFTGNIVKDIDNLKPFDYRSIYRSPEFNEACNYFDKNDTLTRNVLLAVNEADQNVIMYSLSNRLYKHIVDKVDDIDFGTISMSRGDITKIDGYANLVDCINIITEILQNYNQPLDQINVVSTALQNMVDRVDMFTKAYTLNVQMPIIVYNTMTMAIISSVSYMIASCIEFIKLPNEEGFDIAVDKVGLTKTKERMLFKDLEKFNKICSTGEFDKAMDFAIQQNAQKAKGFVGDIGLAAGGVAVGIGLILLIIPLIRELIFIFYFARSSASNYFDIQAQLLEMNAYNVENNLTKDAKTKKEIAKKQRKVADSFKKISNTIKVDVTTGEKKAETESKKIDAKKYKQDEVLDKIPDSANSILF